VGVSRSVLSAIERGIYGPSVQVFSRIAETLGIPMSLLAPAQVVFPGCGSSPARSSR
jgi:transcriptional regulator with XRE-family HTH domain